MLRTILKKMRSSFRKNKTCQFGRQGEHNQIHESCQFNHCDNIELGSYISIQRDCTFSGHGGIQIGDGTIIAHCVDVFSGEHNYDSDDLQSLPFDECFILEKVTIGKNVWIGARCIILPGVTIGDGAVIGAGSVVTYDIPPLAIAAGNPAKVIRYRNEKRYHELASSGKTLLEEREKKHCENEVRMWIKRN